MSNDASTTPVGRDATSIVVGGGIVGLATARALQLAGASNVVVLDKATGPGAHQTGHNSGVIHSGLYYKPGSFKARLCVEGAASMKQFCAEHDVPYRVSGKLVVAVDESELDRLDELERRGTANGITGITRLDPAQMREYEPHVAGIAGLHIPATGVTDYTAVSAAIAADVVGRGGEIRWGTEVARIDADAAVPSVELSSGERLTADRIVVCAGVQSDRLAPDRNQLRIIPFRGAYFDLTPEAGDMVRSMIYPVPDPRFPFLGVHFTRHVDDTVSAGPNAVLALAREAHRRYAFDRRDALDIIAFPGMWRVAGKYWLPGAKEVMYDASLRLYVRLLQRYMPEIERSHVVPGGVGLRAQAVDRSGGLLDDFAITQRGAVTYVQNAPSPAATASLAIGNHIATTALTPA